MSSVRKLNQKQRQRINNYLESYVYERLDAVMADVFGAEPAEESHSARAYTVPLSTGHPGFRINPVGAIRRLEKKGVDWRKELKMTIGKRIGRSK